LEWKLQQELFIISRDSKYVTLFYRLTSNVVWWNKNVKTRLQKEVLETPFRPDLRLQNREVAKDLFIEDHLDLPGLFAI